MLPSDSPPQPASAERLQTANDRLPRTDGKYVLYWMTAFRRTAHNFALEHAAARAIDLGRPLLIFEPLRAGYRWASDRMHRFVIEGMRDNADTVESSRATYYPYVEPKPGEGSGLFEALAKDACLVVGDDYPSFFLPALIRRFQDRLPVPLEMVDGNGLIPLRLPGRTFTVAHSYRRWVQKNILDALLHTPHPSPANVAALPAPAAVPRAIAKRWPPAKIESLLRPGGLDEIPIDHSVGPVEEVVGGPGAAAKRWQSFLDSQLSDYHADRNHPDRHATSSLSPYLHFGHLSAHQMVDDLLDRESWTPDQVSDPNGKNHGFWNVSEPVEAFLDQLLVWREMGFNLAHREPARYQRYESLPDWALKTLAEHADDPRPQIYGLETFEAAETHDELWNAAQRQLVQTGTIHNYLRMLWGKKILHWSRSPEEALRIMIELNNKYALDGRDPNSYSGIFWVLGRYDRAWGPKRPVFGSVRYMTSDSARRKLKLTRYLDRFGSP